MNTPSPATRNGAQALVEVLHAQGVDLAFCVPGESYLAVLDAFIGAGINLVTCRHEAGAGNMAEATGKLTGRAGVCFVTRGPGTAHATIAVHTAQQDATPLVLFVGQIATADRDREAFQEVDYRAMFGTVAKWAVEIDHADRVPELVTRAFHVAESGRPGPVVVALPEDMLVAPCATPVPPRVTPLLPVASPEALAAVAERVQAAQRPIAIIGGSHWSAADMARLVAFAEAQEMPVATAFRRKDRFPNSHRLYTGDLGFVAPPALLKALQEADLILALGSRLADITTGGYTRLDAKRTAEVLVHVHPVAEELHKVFPAAVAVQADARTLLPGLAALPAVAGATRTSRTAFAAATTAGHLAWKTPGTVTGRVHMGEVVQELRRQLPVDGIVASGAGNFAAWLHRYFMHDAPHTQLAPASGAMGYGLPAAIGAALRAPGRRVVGVVGDGCGLMSITELATAAMYRAPVVFLLVNNGSYGTIRMYQEARYPGRVSATDLANPDFTALAKGFGLAAERVEATAGFGPALARAFQHVDEGRGPALIEIITDVRDIAPGRTIS